MEKYTGRIIKGIGGFYCVAVAGVGIFECRAKGLFRNDNIKPLVGDMVRLHPVVDTDIERPGSIDEVLPRSTVLIRPAIANIDRAIVIFAAANPEPNLSLLDRFLCEMERQGVESVVCFNKKDLVSGERAKELCGIYERAGYTVIETSAKEGEIGGLLEALRGRVCTLAGPSGAGKSSIVNLLQSKKTMETGGISKKLGRGRHTTRHSELLPVDGLDDTYIADTPGFSSLDIQVDDAGELGALFPEIKKHEPGCKFSGCAHIREKECAVRAAVREGLISAERYKSYTAFYEEIKSRDRRKKYPRTS